MRIGELIVFASQSDSQNQFVKSICNQIEIITNDMCLGRLPITNQLMLQFYGITLKHGVNYSVDLLSPKVLGYIFIFNWDDKDSIYPMREMIDKLESTFQSPIIIVAAVKDEAELSIAKRFYESEGFSLDSLSRFTFCDIKNSESARKVTTSLINIILNRMS